MSLLRRDAPPPAEAWEALREWSRQSWWARYRASLMVMLPFTTLVLAMAAIALLIVVLWAIGVPVTALGYMRRMARSAALVPPISAASQNPTTAVDIRGNRNRPND